MPDFKPIRKTTVSAEIIDQIMSMIRDGTLKPGDKLPSERELGELLQVGRSSLREAFKALESLGHVIRTTEGTVLSESSGIAGLWLDVHSTTIHEIIEVRKLLETEIGALAAKRATTKDITKLRKACSIVKTYTVREVTDSDVLFHRSLVECTKNSALTIIYDLVARMLFQTHKYYFIIESNAGTEESLKNIVSQHSEILKAIESHDEEAARKAVKEHLEYVEKEIISKMDNIS